MSALRPHPRVFTISAGMPFLPTLVDSIRSGRFHSDDLFWSPDDPMALSDTTIYVPTRRAARALRSLFVDKGGGAAAILPVVRPLGEFEDDLTPFEAGGGAAFDLAPPIGGQDRLLRLAPLVRGWIERLPAHLSQTYGEDVVVPTSSADALWLARDLAALMDEIETEGADWSRLDSLVPDTLANWWQITRVFLSIVSQHWPDVLASLDRSNPAAHRNALILAEAERLERNPPTGPVIVAGSTGSIPATAKLLLAIARLPKGAVILPGLDQAIDDEAWATLGKTDAAPSVYGHPQFQLAKLVARLGVLRRDVEPIGAVDHVHSLRMRALSEAMRPAETTDVWASGRRLLDQADVLAAFEGVSLIDAPTERDEALAIAVALRTAIETPGHTAALVTGDRTLARRVSAELRRFGIRADDSGGLPLAKTPPATLLLQAVRAVFTPGDPVAILSLLKHPLLSLGLERTTVRGAAEMIELVALRGGNGRPDVSSLGALFEERFSELGASHRKPHWLERLTAPRLEAARAVTAALQAALEPLADLRHRKDVTTEEATRLSVTALEGLGRGADGSLAELYAGEAGAALADFLRGLIAAQAGYAIPTAEWCAVLDALIATETVKPTAAGDGRISIWGALEARLQTVDTLVVGGLNEGTWPRRVEPDRFLSRGMKTGLMLDPPERRIGQAAHDFMMALGGERVVLSRSARSGSAPAVQSRWLQRLTTFLGPHTTKALAARGAVYLDWARRLDDRPDVPFAPRPRPSPPLDARPKAFFVTEIETLRRDPYAIYARHVLALTPLEALLRDPGAAERGNLFHEILQRFVAEGVDPHHPDALAALINIGREVFAGFALPEDLHVVWWPRFEAMAAELLEWERDRRLHGLQPRAELSAGRTEVGRTGVTLRGRADRIDLRAGGLADILDYKTGSNPSRVQAHTLISPQLALEAALMMRGAFADLGARRPSDLAYIRLKPDGQVLEDSILEARVDGRTSLKSAPELAEEAWRRLDDLLTHYDNPANGYLSRALPFREGATDGDYDHLARVLEWSAGADEAEGEG